MCGRFTLAREQGDIEAHFHAHFRSRGFRPRYNVSPTQQIAVIRNTDPSLIESITWGMKPVWWNVPHRSLINIRLETLKEKPTFKHLLLQKRCLIISDGFYEWKTVGKGKQPYFITVKPKRMFAFPGLWNEEKDEHGKKIISCALITTEANQLVEKVHDRMPCILSHADDRRWLNETDPKKLFSYLKQWPANKMRAYPVGSAVGSPRIDLPRLIKTIDLAKST